MDRFNVRNLLAWGTGCLSLAFLAGCIGLTSSGSSGDGSSLSTQTKGGVVDTSKAGCGHEDMNVGEKDHEDSAGVAVKNEKDDSTEVGGCDDKGHGDKGDSTKVGGDKEVNDSDKVADKDSTEVK